MKILFTLLHLPETNLAISNGMYIDLAKECSKMGHSVTIIGGSLAKTRFNTEQWIDVLRVKTNKIVGEKNLIKKGVGMAILPYLFKRAFKKYLKTSNFDWVVMPTPPITLIDFISYLKRSFDFKFYMILRDIHPQSSWSLGEIKYKWMYNYLDKRSLRGYKLADIIGCMSQGNIGYILSQYPNLQERKFKVLHNWMQPIKELKIDGIDVRKKYNLENKVIALFGGNLSYGQKVDNIIDLASKFKTRDNVNFVIIGKGPFKEFMLREKESKNLTNMLFLDYMPQNEYLNFASSVDVGLISINEKNAAPTCPSKLVSYMAMKIPVLAMINPNNDYGTMIDNIGVGFWSVASDKEKIYKLFELLINDEDKRKQMGKNGYNFYCENMTTEIVAHEMLSQMKKI